LPPVIDVENAWVMARAKPPALSVSAWVFVVRLSSVLDVSCKLVLSAIVLSLARRIWKPRQQIVEFHPQERRNGWPANRSDCMCEFARRHPPEGIRREPQHAEAEAHRFRPGKRFHRAAPSSKVAAISSAAILTKPAAPPSAVIAETSSSVTASPAPRKPAAMMR